MNVIGVMMKKLEMNRCVYVKGPGSTSSQCQGRPPVPKYDIMGESIRHPFPMVHSAEVPDDVSMLMREMAKNRPKGGECDHISPGTESANVHEGRFSIRFTGITRLGNEMARAIAPNMCKRTGNGPSCSNPALESDTALLLRQAIILGSPELFDAIAKSDKSFESIPGGRNLFIINDGITIIKERR
jgi:hypothetical protein